MLISKIKNNYLRLIYFFILLIFSEIFFSLQYTQTAILAAGIGTLLFLKSNNLYQKILVSLLILVGILLRPEAAVIGILLVTFIYFNFKIYREFFTPIILATVGLFIFYFDPGGFAPWNSQTGKESLSYYSSLNTILDYEPTIEIASDIRDASNKVGWSQNGQTLFYEKFYIGDNKIFSKQANIEITKQINQNFDLEYLVKVIIKFHSVLASQ